MKLSLLPSYRVSTRTYLKGVDIQSVPVERLLFTEDFIDTSSIGRSTTPILTIKLGESFVILDGNHRARRAIERKARKVRIQILREEDKGSVIAVKGTEVSKYVKRWIENKLSFNEMKELFIETVRKKDERH